MADHAIPDSRTVLIKGAHAARFSHPKDPDDNAWFKATFEEVLESVDTVTVTAGATVGTGEDEPVLTVDKRSVQFRLSAGNSGSVETLTFVVTTAEGSELHRTATIFIIPL